MRRPLLRAGVAGACFLTAAVLGLPAHAEGQPGDGFVGFALTAQAHGFQITEDQPSANSHPESDAEVPHTAVSLTGGPVGYGLSSIAWPGALAGNAGSLILLVRPDAPQQVKTLNDPVRAEARTGAPMRDVSNDTVSGAHMHAKAEPDTVTSDALVNGGSAGETAGFGRTTSVSTVRLLATAAASVADSTGKDLSFAAGVVAIKSVTSHAEALTDGVRASAKGITSVSGMTVAGVPVSVDERGVTANGGHLADPIATETVNTALANIGMTITLSKPSKDISGGSARYDAGSLIMNWKPPGSVNVITASVGGARVLASASPGGGPVRVTRGVTPPGTAPSVQQPAVVPPGIVPAGGSSSSGTAPLTSVGSAPVTVSPQQPGEFSPSAARSLLDGHGIPLSALLLTLFGAAVLLSGVIRVPGLMLSPPPPVHCPLEDTP